MMAKNQTILRLLLADVQSLADAVALLPAAEAFKQRHRKATVAAVVSPRIAQFLEDLPVVNFAATWDTSARKTSWGAWREKMRNWQMQAAIHLGTPAGRNLALASGCQVRIAPAQTDGWSRFSSARTTHAVSLSPNLGPHQGLHLLEVIGDFPKSPRLTILERPEEVVRTQQLLWDSHLGSGFALIAVGNCVGNYSQSCLGRVARYLERNHSLPGLVLAESAESSQAAEQVVAFSGGRAVAAPKLPLSAIASLMRRASVVIGADPAAIDLAGLLGAPGLLIDEQLRTTTAAERLRHPANCNTGQKQASGSVETICAAVEELLSMREVRLVS